jgi:hypothetical protein
LSKFEEILAPNFSQRYFSLFFGFKLQDNKPDHQPETEKSGNFLNFEGILAPIFHVFLSGMDRNEI